MLVAGYGRGPLIRPPASDVRSRSRGSDLIEVNPYPSDLSPLCRVTIHGPAGEILPSAVERVRATARRLGAGSHASR